MSIEEGGQAYPMGYHPCGNRTDHQGMTLRDYFAAKAMHSIVLMDGIQYAHAFDEHAEAAYKQADAMIKARGKNGN